MHTFTSVTRRSMTLGVAVALLVATIIPAAAAYADALNPLTERSLLLSSSAPGYMDSDGSGNPTYAPPGSGPNGKKTGQTFSFRVSTDSTNPADNVKGISLQYCTVAAGKCQSPGNNTGDDRDGDRGSDSLENETSDLNVNFDEDGFAPIAGEDYKIFVDLDDDGLFAAGEEVTTGWNIAVDNWEDDDYVDPQGGLTGKNNYIMLSSTTGANIPAGAKVQIVFEASDHKYITNPGEGEFFVKLNTYRTSDTTGFAQSADEADVANIIDGGVTVANVMTDSIHITTKVLETMSFSVGNHLRDSEEAPVGGHVKCSPIDAVNGNRLELGDQNAEYSLEIGETHEVFSYWRLSSNSSGGATVYYSGDTLANTVEDKIRPMDPTTDNGSNIAITGTEQFGLAIMEDDDVAQGIQSDLAASFKLKLDSSAGNEANYDPAFSLPTLLPLDPVADYSEGSGTINAGVANTAKFAFDPDSLTTPMPIASNTNEGGVLSCTTAKMRYIANIGADTPAGVYTTKINYLAAPQY